MLAALAPLRALGAVSLVVMALAGCGSDGEDGAPSAEPTRKTLAAIPSADPLPEVDPTAGWCSLLTEGEVAALGFGDEVEKVEPASDNSGACTWHLTDGGVVTIDGRTATGWAERAMNSALLRYGKEARAFRPLTPESSCGLFELVNREIGVRDHAVFAYQTGKDGSETLLASACRDGRWGSVIATKDGLKIKDRHIRMADEVLTKVLRPGGAV